LLENRYGRTQLQSLKDDDDQESSFMYIQTFHIDDEYKQNENSDIGATALRQFLHHPFIKGNGDGEEWWNVSSAAYVLDPTEAMTASARNAEHPEEQEQDRLSRSDANQFLRNGFFQDPALAKNGGSNARIIVASYQHWKEAMKSHDEAVAVTFCPPPPKLTGNDRKILDTIKRKCGMAEYSASPNDSSPYQTLFTEIQLLCATTGSLVRSHALHAACANNALPVVNYILEHEPNTIESRDQNLSTPLMVAASSAAGRNTNSGIAETVVIDRLLAAGANKSLQDDAGMTAYGNFLAAKKEYEIMIIAMTGGNVRPRGNLPSVQALETKLRPTEGPSPGDVSGGTGANTGFVDYTQVDAGVDREMGSGDSDDDSDDESKGDY
jgi:hypothetical protein